MDERQILVVGAGLAGTAAAVELARAGHRVLVVDRAARAGGAIHRQPLPGRAGVETAAPRWARLWAEAQALPIDWAFETRFAGLDHQGSALLTGGLNRLMRPAAMVLATGAREAVRPRPGWTLPGVITAGAAQMQLKTLGEAPKGRLLLAGSGPLLIALAAQLTRLGNAPVAVIEAGQPFAHPLLGLRLPASYLREAVGYMSTLIAHRVPLLTGAEVNHIAPEGAGLRVTLRHRGRERSFSVDQLCLHDGIRPNDAGLTDCAAIPVLRLGDCAEALGARAALAAGRAGGAALVKAFASGARPGPIDPAALRRERDAQALLARIYAHCSAARLADLPGDTVLCRCENRTLDDLRALGPAPRARQVRLNGRFGMGACQGRFCGEWVAQALGQPTPTLGAPRWPAAPISISDLLHAAPDPSPPYGAPK